MRYLNDTHCEMGEYHVPHLDTDKDTILSLAGDIYDRKRLMPWLRNLSTRFKAIVMVRGNHDYWNGSMDVIEKTQLAYVAEHKLDNVHILNNTFVVIDNIIYYGGTMWTDYNKQDPITKLSYDKMMDYKRIRTHNHMKRFNVNMGHSIHLQFKSGLHKLLNDPQYAGLPIFVISHHAPCTLSISERYLYERVINGFYVSDLSDLILDNPRIIQWHHGHLHNASDYMLGGCRIICNPIGYPGEVIVGSNPLKREVIQDLVMLAALNLG